MKKILATSLLLLTVLAGCQKKKDSSADGLGILGSEETAQVVEIITDANNDLKKVKAIYKNNQSRVSDLKEAMTAKDIDKVKSIADDLVLQINEGLVLGKIAIEKIKKAEDLNVNDTYKDYLRLKREGLEKQIEAFELRRQVAKQLSEIFGKNDPKALENVQTIFREKEEGFQKLMEEGQTLSREANQVAKDASRGK